MTIASIGTVSLVGAGPGDPGLITVKGLERIERSDVIVYDRLANPRLLERARADAELIYVGKLPDRHTLRQEEINQLLVDKAKEGKSVCRLKGGDPYVFGRGGEEAETLVEAGIPFEVIPGITAAIAASAYAGIPVTHREMASSVALITGHEDPTKDDSSINWPHLATGVDTLVFYMGVGNLPLIVEQLVRHGRPPRTPVAVIRWGTTPDQETYTGTLADIVSIVEQRQVKPPALTVVGEVVRLRDKLRWFDVSPLFGKRVIVTRAREQASEFASRLEALGAEVIEFPVIRIVDLESYERLDIALSYLKEYDWIVFTSVNGVDAFFHRAHDQGVAVDAKTFERIKVCAIGPATAERCRSHGLKVAYVPDRFVAESVAEGFAQLGVESKRILIPRAEEAREVLPQKLEEMGAQVDVVPVYRTVLDDANAETVKQRIQAGEVDVITFTSSSTVKNFVKLVGEELVRTQLADVCVAYIGPITADTAKSFGMRVDVLAEEFTIDGLTQALSQHFASGSNS